VGALGAFATTRRAKKYNIEHRLLLFGGEYKPPILLHHPIDTSKTGKNSAVQTLGMQYTDRCFCKGWQQNFSIPKQTFYLCF
ncbi:MAG TPA: hypothetical protein PKD90_14505, partial [Phnomibacter sp.]|nr:hypothetical protein [Phnomibacter sp.]